MEQIRANPRNPMVRVLPLLTAASAAILWSQPSIRAEESPPIVVSQSITLLEFARQLSREQGSIIGAEVADQRRLHGQVRAGRYTLTAALEEIQRQLAASAYVRNEGAICFLSGVAPAKPALQMSGSFVQRREQVAKVNRILDSLSPDQLEELRSNGATIPVHRLHGDQQASITELAGQGVIMNGVPFDQNPKAVITLQFRTTMTIGTPDGGYKSIQIGDSTWPLQDARPGQPSGKEGRTSRLPSTRTSAGPPAAQARDAAVGAPPSELEQEIGGTTLVKIPYRESATYTLGELAALATETCRQEVIVDRRAEDRQLLLVSPGGSVPTSRLLTIMGRTLQLHWRKVDALAFLTYFPDDVQERTTREERDKLKQAQTKLLDDLSQHLPGAAPISADELFSGRRSWSNLTAQERSQMLHYGSLAGSDDRQWLAGFFRTGGVVNDSTFGFRMDLVLHKNVGRSGGSRAMELGP